MKLNKTSIISSVMAAAIVVSSAATFALWSAESSTTGASLKSGTFSVAAGAATWHDISKVANNNALTSSTAVTGAPAITNVGNFLLSPGDVVASTQDVTLSLTGNNLLANLTVQMGTQTGALLESGGVTLKTYVFSSDGATKIAESTAPNGSISAIQLKSTTFTGTSSARTASNLKVVTVATFPSGTSGVSKVNTTGKIGDLTVRLAQVSS